MSADEDIDDEIDAFRALVDTAQNIVFFTGAGISTESGIPDFRSPGTGLWNKIKPIQVQDFLASEEMRQESWRRRFTGDRKMENAKPNKGHEAVSRLIVAGQGTAIITQNVDNPAGPSGNTVPSPESDWCDSHRRWDSRY